MAEIEDPVVAAYVRYHEVMSGASRGEILRNWSMEGAKSKEAWRAAVDAASHAAFVEGIRGGIRSERHRN